MDISYEENLDEPPEKKDEKKRNTFTTFMCKTDS